MPQIPYTLFKKHQGGVCTLSREIPTGFIGTRNVGSTIALFVYDTTYKQCLAIHIDPLISIELIKTQISSFLKSRNANKCSGYVIGGWDTQFHVGDPRAIELPAILATEFHVGHIQTKLIPPSILRPKEPYYSVIFNLNTGDLHCNATWEDEDKEFMPFLDDIENVIMYNDCMNYAKYNNDTSIKDALANLQQFKLAVRSPDHTVFFDRMIQETNGSSLIPINLLADAAHAQNVLLLDLICERDVLGVLVLLSENFVNPVSTVYRTDDRRTPLHSACEKLNKHPNSFNLKMIVLLVLMHGKRDIADKHGYKALDFVRHPDLIDFVNVCNELLLTLQSNNLLNPSALYKVILLLYAEHVYTVGNLTREAAKESESDILTLVQMMIPRYREEIREQVAQAEQTTNTSQNEHKPKRHKPA